MWQRLRLPKEQLHQLCSWPLRETSPNGKSNADPIPKMTMNAKADNELLDLILESLLRCTRLREN